MSSLYLFQLASRNAEWLAARQTAIAGNVANANTPAYRAMDVKPFSALIDQSTLQMAATHPDHLQPSPFAPAAVGAVEGDASNATLSGNSVHLEEEMTKLGEVSRSYALGANLRRVFQQLFVASLK